MRVSYAPFGHGVDGGAKITDLHSLDREHCLATALYLIHIKNVGDVYPDSSQSEGDQGGSLNGWDEGFSQSAKVRNPHN